MSRSELRPRGDGSFLKTTIDDWLHRCRIRPMRSTTIDGITFSFANGAEFSSIYRNVFVDHEYRFDAATATPFILDCGAHIGVSVLYFKALYPQATVAAFEPNPDVFELLKLNVGKNNLADVELVNAAVAGASGEIDFYTQKGSPREWTWGSAGVKNGWHDPTACRTIRVPAVRLSSYIDREVDLLKLDVEGMEEVVLADIETALSMVKEIVIEFHGSSTNDRNSLERVLRLLELNGFGYRMKQGTEMVTLDGVERTDPYWLIVRARRG